MVEWITVNGAKIEKSYFDANVAEAKSYSWTPYRWQEGNEHSHCIVCGVEICVENPDCFQSDKVWLCGYCFYHFVSNKNT